MTLSKIVHVSQGIMIMELMYVNPVLAIAYNVLMVLRVLSVHPIELLFQGASVLQDI